MIVFYFSNFGQKNKVLPRKWSLPSHKKEPVRVLSGPSIDSPTTKVPNARPPPGFAHPTGDHTSTALRSPWKGPRPPLPPQAPRPLITTRQRRRRRLRVAHPQLQVPTGPLADPSVTTGKWAPKEGDGPRSLFEVQICRLAPEFSPSPSMRSWPLISLDFCIPPPPGIGLQT